MSEQIPAFGRVITAMVTPFSSEGINLPEARRLARHLVTEQANDALVLNGTTGEAPTTSDAEKRELVSAVVEEVGDDAVIIAGVGTPDTAHSIQLAEHAQAAGADALLVVAPYYSRPPEAAMEAHFLAIADATELPIMLYDIPHRTGMAIPEDMLIRLAQHPNIVAVKDAKQNVVSSSAVIANTTLQYYAGDDGYLLPLMAVGGVGVVGTSTHFTGRQVKDIVDAFVAGEIERAQQLNADALPVFRGVFATQGAMMVKAALNARGFAVGACRPPMGEVPSDVVQRFLELLDRHLD